MLAFTSVSAPYHFSLCLFQILPDTVKDNYGSIDRISCELCQHKDKGIASTETLAST